MKAAVYKGEQRLEVEEVPTPEAGQALPRPQDAEGITTVQLAIDFLKEHGVADG